MYIYIYTHTHIYICIYIKYIYMSMIIFTLNYIHEYMYILICIHTQLIYACICIYSFIHSVYTLICMSLQLHCYNIIIYLQPKPAIILGFPGGSMVKNLSGNAGDVGLVPGSGRSPGEGNGNPLQYSSQGNLRDRRAWQASVHGFAKELGVI